MISSEKTKILYEYSKPINWNISGFGNTKIMTIISNIIERLLAYNILFPIKTIHGSYICKYNGGRLAHYPASNTEILNNINYFNNLGIGVKLTFSNLNIHKEQFEEKEMRWYLDILNEVKGIGNGIICVNDDFAELVKKNYPNLELVASHVKLVNETKLGETDTYDYYNSKFDLYDTVVINTTRVFDDDFLAKIIHPEKIEVIANHYCTPNCLKAAYHHSIIDKLEKFKIKYNGNMTAANKDKEFAEVLDKLNKLSTDCRNIKDSSSLETLSKQHLNREEINHLAKNFNITNFKLEGRDFPETYILSYINNFILNGQSVSNCIFI